MDIKQLKYFIKVAQNKSYSKAAKQLFVTQPTLSLSIKKLEQELKTPLFKHHEREIVLTKAGEFLYTHGQLLITDFDNLISKTMVFGNDYQKTIRIGLTSLFAIQFMKQISTFIAAHTHISVTFIQEGSLKLQQLLNDGHIDIALVSTPIHYDNLHIEPLHTSISGYHVSVVLPKTHPLANCTSLRLIDLKEEIFASLSDNFVLGAMLIKKCEALNIKPHIVFKHDDWEVITHSLQDLQALTLLPTEFKPLCKLDTLKWIPFDDTDHFFSICIATAQKEVSSTLQTLINILKTN